MRSLFKIWLFVLTFLADLADADPKKYTLADLKALVAAKAYPEAVAHLGDVAPAQRTADWLDVAFTAAIGYVEGALPSARLERTFVIEHDYPQVLRSPAYLAVRARFGPDIFTDCFQTHDFIDCRDWAVVFVDADLQNGPLQLAIAKVIRHGFSSFESAVPFFTRALAANKPDVVCPDPDLELAVVAAMSLPPTDKRLAAAKAIATACWSNLREPVLQLTWEKGQARDNACALLRSRKETPARCPRP